METKKYLAVFKSLSYAGRVKNEFIYPKRPEIVKTPKGIMGGCSYSLVFPEEQLEFMLRAAKRHKKGFMGIYREMSHNNFEVVYHDLP